MRTVTNFYLLNLAVSDLLVTVFCMPATLIALIFQCFLFGDVMCKLIAYLQPVAVTVNSYTLAAISLDRFYLICSPFKSRFWHTPRLAVYVIGSVWAVSFILNIMPLFMYHLAELESGQLNCRYLQSVTNSEIVAYHFYVVTAIFCMPFFIMANLYLKMILSLKNALRTDSFGSACSSLNFRSVIIESSSHPKLNTKPKVLVQKTISIPKVESIENKDQKRSLSPHNTGSPNGAFLSPCSSAESLSPKFRRREEKNESSKRSLKKAKNDSRKRFSDTDAATKTKKENDKLLRKQKSAATFPNITAKITDKSLTIRKEQECLEPPLSLGGIMDARPSIRGASLRLRVHQPAKVTRNKKRLILMLIVVMIAFFICWTPLYIYWTIYHIGRLLNQLIFNKYLFPIFTTMAYLQSCLNPIIYCFLNKKFRVAFFNVLHPVSQPPSGMTVPIFSTTQRPETSVRPSLVRPLASGVRIFERPSFAIENDNITEF